MSAEKNIEQAYLQAKQRYQALGIDTDDAIARLSKIPISLHCWQGDDVTGFESEDGQLSGVIQATGAYHGKARNINELMGDLDKVISLVPGKCKLNLHAIYLDNKGKSVDRDEIKPENFQCWVDWAKKHNTGLDFNPTFFSHPKAADGFTLSHPDKGIRDFWIEHGKACRRIAEYMGKELNNTCVTNFWVPDGYKDLPADRKNPRLRLMDSLDKIFEEKTDPAYELDAVESKLFGIGVESYTTGSHEFYMGYAVSRQKLICLDSGHFHPTEMVSDKVSSVMNFVPGLLLHISRPVRWDSDHVVIYDEELNNIMQELVGGDYLDKTHIGLDFFDASINRLAAWVIGSRNAFKALLGALLQPYDMLRKFEAEQNYTSRLAIKEELKSMPLSAVWDYYCLKNNVPVGIEWLNEINEYEKNILSKRS